MKKETLMKQLKKADEGGYAVPHFNFSDIWDLEAIVKGAEEMHSPVIAAALPKVNDALGMHVVGAMAKALAESAKVPVYLHLDHSTEVQVSQKDCDENYSLVMLDASKETLEENIKRVKKVVDYARPRGVFVEGEIGMIKGRTEEGNYTEDDFLVRVEDAVELAEKSGLDILAVGIGTAHGFYQGKPEINFKRLAEVNEALELPLVMHGGTGIPEEDVRRAIRNGINKVNVGTIIKYTYLSTVKEVLDREGPTIYTTELMKPAVNAVKEEVKRWIRTCMADGKA